MFKDYGISRKEIEDRMKLLVFEFRVPEEEARKTIINGLRKTYNISRESLRYPLTKIAEIEPNKWVTVKAKVLQLWETTSPAIAQWGIIGDDTGIARFVIWAKANKKGVEEGKCYLFERVVIDDFNGVKSVKVTSMSEIKELEEDLDVPETGEIEMVGALIAIQQNSGLVQVCKKCGKFVKTGICKEHGRVETTDILRLRGVLDDGEKTVEVVMDEECIKALTGIDLETAKKLAAEQLDREVVLMELKNKLLGKYLRIQGEMGFRGLQARKVEFYKPKIWEEVEKLLQEVKT